MFAAAPGDVFCFGQLDNYRGKTGALVRAVAEGLGLGSPAGAPPVLPGLCGLDKWKFLEHNGVIHDSTSS